MPNVEFIARNGIVSRGNLVVSGSIVSTSPASFSGSLTVNGDILLSGSRTIQPVTSSVNTKGPTLTLLGGLAGTSSGNGGDIVLKGGNSINTGNVGGDVYILGGDKTGSQRPGYIYIGAASGQYQVYLQGGPIFNWDGPNAATAAFYQRGGVTRFSIYDDVNLNANYYFNSGANTINAIWNNWKTVLVKGSGTTSSTTAFQVQNANASSSFSIKDNGDSIFTYPGVAGYSLKISGSYSGNGASAIYETLGASGGYYGIHEFRIGTNTANAVRAMSIVYGGRVVIGNRSDAVLQSPGANLLIDTNVINTFTSQSFNTGIIINPSGTLDTRFTASGIQFNYAALNNDTNGGAFVGSQYNPATNGYDADLVIYNSQGSPGSYVETARFVGKSRSLSLGAGRNPSASLHISGSSNSVLLEIDSPAVNNILYVSGSGNVGIGTGTPAAKLDVNGTFKVSNTSTFDSQATFNNANIVATGLNSQVGNFTINRANSNTSVEIVGGATSVKFDAGNGSASTMFLGKTSIAAAYITASAMLHVKSTGATSSTTALLVQNANLSASFSVRDDGTTAVLSSNEKPFTVSHTNGSSALGIVVGNGSAIAPGFAALRLNDSVNVFTFSSGRTITALPLTVGSAAETFFIRGGGGGSDVVNPSVALTDNTYNTGGYTVTSGTQTTVQIGGIGAPSNAIWKPASGNANYNLLVVAPNMSGSGTYSGTIRGIYYNPTVDSTTYGAHRAIETTAGDVVFNGGRVTISGSAGSGSALYAYKSGSTVLDIQGSQGQLFSVIDTLSGSLMSVNDISGLPIVEVFSDDRVVMGTYGAPGLTVSGSTAAVATGSSAPTGTAPEGTFRFAIAGGLYYIYAYIGGAWRSGSLA